MQLTKVYCKIYYNQSSVYVSFHVYFIKNKNGISYLCYQCSPLISRLCLEKMIKTSAIQSCTFCDSKIYSIFQATKFTCCICFSCGLPGVKIINKSIYYLEEGSFFLAFREHNTYSPGCKKRFPSILNQIMVLVKIFHANYNQLGS